MSRRTLIEKLDSLPRAAFDGVVFRSVAPGYEPLSGEGANAWSVRVYYKPFVVWIWGGCLLMACGGVLAAADRRYRLKKARLALAGAAA